MQTIIVHINNAEAIKLDVEELPQAQDTVVIGKNPRLRSDREVEWVDDGVTTIIIPWHRINFIQVMPSANEELDFPMLYRD